eukprot:Seg852.3 transcript_id=Seg852.3/GoldUCD/mRNA.D3Y31 product="hypothetical protein" protein_id=Seg852.3/GoldUCD/D3Y31
MMGLKVLRNCFGLLGLLLSLQFSVSPFAEGYKIKANSKMPLPFTRELRLQDPLQSGKDVIILQNLLKRFPETKHLKITSQYDVETAEMVKAFQASQDLTQTGVVCDKTAMIIVDMLMSDGFKDDAQVPHGYKFKLLVPVYRDRTIETTATLLDKNSQPVYKFQIRLHGRTPLNQLTRNGNTPTGLATFDLNSKEPNPKSFGPYPVVRIVKGIKGNLAIGYQNKTFLSDFRSGILLHTGQWNGWDPSKPMPNSLGCMHCAPDDMKNIVEILQNKLGVEVRPNPFGKLPYPYEPQGLIAIEQMD